MRIIDYTLEQYLTRLGSDAPAPGGGSAAALTGAQGAALTSMVAALTLDRPKFASDQALCRSVRAESDHLTRLLRDQIDADTDAYTAVYSAYRMPKGTEAEHTARKNAICEALLLATRVPMTTMELSHDGIMLTETLVGRSNPNAASDLGVAALSFSAAAHSAFLNVEINLPGLGDPVLSEQFRERGAAILSEIDRLAAGILTRTKVS